MPSRWTRALTTVLATALVVTAPATFAVAVQTPEEQLREARERLERVTTDLDEAESAREDADSELADADARLAEVEAVVNDVAAALERQRGAVAEAEDRLAAIEAEADAIRARLETRIASMFKQGGVRDFNLLLSSNGAEEALARTSYLRALTLDDRAVSEQLAAAEVRVDAERALLVVEQERLDALLAEQGALLADVERLRQRRALAAADARARVEQLESEQDDLEAESAKLEELIRERQEQARREAAARAAAAARQRQTSPPRSGGGSTTTTTSPAPSASGYAWPICARVTSEYGPRWGRMHRGIDLGARSGTAIGAAKAGRVIFAGWQGGYGNLVLIDHGDGVVTAYAHQSRIAVGNGASVSRGQTIGYVGSTGNSTGPHLHLETRVNGSAVNPRQYFRGSPC